MAATQLIRKGAAARRKPGVKDLDYGDRKLDSGLKDWTRVRNAGPQRPSSGAGSGRIVDTARKQLPYCERYKKGKGCKDLEEGRV